jgi:hypothetical protein
VPIFGIRDFIDDLEWYAPMPFMRAVVIPGLVIVALAALSTTPIAGGVAAKLTISLLVFACTAALCVRSQRLMLLGPQLMSFGGATLFIRAAFVYFAQLAGLGIAVFLAQNVFALLIKFISAGSIGEPTSLELDGRLTRASYVTLAVSMYVAARLSFVLPSIALRRHWSYREAWSVTHGNGWRIAVLVFLVPYFLVTMLFVMRQYLTDPILAAVCALAFVFTLSNSAMCLSLAYRCVTEPAPPPTAPPA